MLRRTQISLSEDDRQLLDGVAARTGRSIAALIRAAIHIAYATPDDTEQHLASMRQAFGAWQRESLSGADYVERLRSGRRVRRG